MYLGAYQPRTVDRYTDAIIVLESGWRLQSDVPMVTLQTSSDLDLHF